jgi:hypothetical protein
MHIDTVVQNYLPMKLNHTLKTHSKIKGNLKLHVMASISQEIYLFSFDQITIQIIDKFAK